MLDGFVQKVQSKNARLVICGSDDDWIPQTYSDSRLIYLGLLSPKDANAVGRACHVGLIPQNEHGYCHLMEPTKLGFYLTLGLPVVVTKCNGLMAFIKKYGCGLVASFDSFGEYLNELAESPDKMESCRKSAESLSEGFFWDKIFDKASKDFQAHFDING